jgi:glycine cleavage system H protein
MPVAGEILELNKSLNDAAELVNTDPYEKGWLIRIKMTDAAELDDLLTADQYKELIAE